MKIASMIARYLLGLGFLIFGLNGLFHFMPQPPMPPGTTKDWIDAMTAAHYMTPVSVFQVLAGVLLLVNRYVPLALTILGPILVNILMFHILLAPATLPMALVFVILWVLVFMSVRSAFSGLFQSQVEG